MVPVRLAILMTSVLPAWSDYNPLTVYKSACAHTSGQHVSSMASLAKSVITPILRLIERVYNGGGASTHRIRQCDSCHTPDRVVAFSKAGDLFQRICVSATTASAGKS